MCREFQRSCLFTDSRFVVNTEERGKGNYFLIAFCLIVLWLFLRTAIKINWDVEYDCFYN